MTQRIVSLLPSATEIICALGARAELVGVSHECDFPADVVGLPVLTKPKIRTDAPSGEIDRDVREVVKQALAVYDLDVDALRALAPDVIVTQDICDVCAVSFPQVQEAAKSIVGKDVKVVNLHPERLADIWADIRKVASALGREAAGEALLASMDARVKAVSDRAQRTSTRPSILTIEWIDPIMIGGTWMPELAERCAAKALVTTSGQKAPTLTKPQLEALDPDLVIVKPCGFPLDRTLAEIPTLRKNLPWEDWDAPLNGLVYLCDGNQYFNRPGPRIVDSLEILAACIHPKQFRDFRQKYAKWVAEVSLDESLKRWDEEYIGIEGV
jgi:iron complex transport system substrate-binding protein